MYFNSLEFLFFMVVLFFIYWKLNEKYRWILLLISSYLFYCGWGTIYLLLLVLLTFISYIAGILIQKNKDQKCERFFLVITITGMLLILCGFKYSFFLNSRLR